MVYNLFLEDFVVV